jgi:hypothetical protein
MSHPKYRQFKEAFVAQYGTAKHPHGHKGTIDPGELRIFLEALAANARTVPDSDLRELIEDTSADIPEIVNALTN